MGGLQIPRWLGSDPLLAWWLGLVTVHVTSLHFVTMFAIAWVLNVSIDRHVCQNVLVAHWHLYHTFLQLPFSGVVTVFFVCPYAAILAHAGGVLYGTELGSVTFKRVDLFCFPIKH